MSFTLSADVETEIHTLFANIYKQGYFDVAVIYVPLSSSDFVQS